MAPIPMFVVGRVLKRSQGYIAWELMALVPTQQIADQKCVTSNDFYTQVMTETDLLQNLEAPVAGGVFPRAEVIP